MKKQLLLILTLVAALTACSPKQHPDYPIGEVALKNVSFSDGLLGERMRLVREHTLPFAFKKCEETGRIANFARAAGLDKSTFTGLRYDDSDVYKVMEAAAYNLASHYDASLDHYLDSLIALVGAAQESDGYLYTIRTSGGVSVDDRAGAERWSNIAQSHELYNVGHMYEAAVAHFLSTGKRSFLDIAIKNANLLYDTFYLPGRKIVSGHEEIELALVKLYRATGDKRYLDLSHFLLDCRGEDPGDTHRQNHKKVTEQYEAVGHAVCAGYLYTAMTDIAAISGDKAYRSAVDSLWNDVTDRKFNLTGGLGSRLAGEGFAAPYVLPDEETHCETCAGVASCFWNYRMFRLTGEGRYMDIFERTLYNNVLHGLSDDGTNFFYANVLQCSPYTLQWLKDWLKKRPRSNLRRHYRLPWFETSCCPTNLARIILSLPAYAYALEGNSIYVNLFEGGQSAFETALGEPVELLCETEYPVRGEVRLTLKKAPRKSMALRIRIPGWAQGKPVPGSLYTYLDSSASQPVLNINGCPASYEIQKGYAVLERNWKDGDVVEVAFDMPVRIVKADDRVAELSGRLAVERGPFVFCTTLPSMEKDDIRLLEFSASDHFEVEKDTADVVKLTDTDRKMEFIPYYRHAQRGPTQMSVWVRASR